LTGYHHQCSLQAGYGTSEEDPVNLIPFLRSQYAEAIAADRLRAAEGARKALAARARRAASRWPDAVSVRLARPTDDRELQELAELDSGRVPAGTVLVAEVQGALRAAISIETGVVVADPFSRTATLVDLLALRAAQVRTELAHPAPSTAEVHRAARVATEGGVHHP
jgi:hypothetical protein